MAGGNPVPDWVVILIKACYVVGRRIGRPGAVASATIPKMPPLAHVLFSRGFVVGVDLPRRPVVGPAIIVRPLIESVHRLIIVPDDDPDCVGLGCRGLGSGSRLASPGSPLQ